PAPSPVPSSRTSTLHVGLFFFDFLDFDGRRRKHSCLNLGQLVQHLPKLPVLRLQPILKQLDQVALGQRSLQGLPPAP
ncbi:MAG: hypothetical protein LR120_08880, partial [Dehalococcoidia bacterium]|nr:hypothetical protein [Dehalococcoidia bacterium]